MRREGVPGRCSTRCLASLKAGLDEPSTLQGSLKGGRSPLVRGPRLAQFVAPESARQSGCAWPSLSGFRRFNQPRTVLSATCSRRAISAVEWPCQDSMATVHGFASGTRRCIRYRWSAIARACSYPTTAYNRERPFGSTATCNSAPPNVKRKVTVRSAPKMST